MTRYLTSVLCLFLLALTACDFSASVNVGKPKPSNADIVRLAETYINARDYETLREVVAEDYLRHSQATPDVEVRSFDEFVAFLKQGSAAFPDDKAVFDRLVSEGDYVAFWGRYEGTNTGPGPFPPTGKSISIEMAGIHRIEDGKIAETWVTWDNSVMVQQLGLAPPG